MKQIIAISAGHNQYAPGAMGLIAEHVENRRVVAQLKEQFAAHGWKVADCTDNLSKTAQDIVRIVVKKHLAIPSHVDLQIHFNSGPPTAQGCEVLYNPNFGKREQAERLAAHIARSGQLKNRGAKERDDIWWLNKTRTGLLIEVCFVDNQDDVAHYRAHFYDICAAIVAFFTNEH